MLAQTESIQLVAPPSAVVYYFTTEGERRVEWLASLPALVSSMIVYLLRLPLSEMSNIKCQ